MHIWQSDTFAALEVKISFPTLSSVFIIPGETVTSELSKESLCLIFSPQTTLVVIIPADTDLLKKTLKINCEQKICKSLQLKF